MPLTPLTVLAVEVHATRPTDSDQAFLTHARRQAAERTAAGDSDRPEGDTGQPEAAYVVRIQLEAPPPATGAGWALYVGDLRIPKYWQYPAGIYFKVYDAAFFDQYADSPIRFSADNGTTFTDTGTALGRPTEHAQTDTAPGDLPDQTDLLR